MHFDNPWFIAAILGTIGWFHVELVADFLNLSRLGKSDGDSAQGKLSEEERERMIDYNVRGTRLDILRRAVSLAVLLGFWWCVGFAWLDGWIRSWGLESAPSGVVLIAVLALGQSVLAIPFDAWETFGIEAEFGFNRTTVATFVADRIKGLVLATLIGIPLIWLVVWLFETQRFAAAIAWASVAAFSLLITWLAPRVVMPWFLKFRPLEAGSLREGVLALARRLQFPVSDVSVVDGSRRSSKANAFLAGFGRTKRIALYDTLISSLNEDEILSILAHELAHFKKRHVIQQIALGLTEMAVMFALLDVALRSAGLFAAFGVAHSSTGLGLVLFSIAYRPVAVLLEIARLAFSRRCEYEADAFAAHAVEKTRPLATALDRLSRDYLSHPSPHPFYVRLHYSHPPMTERLGALERLDLASAAKN